MTPGQRWRRRRNLAVLAAASAGLPQRVLADVFDLPRSHVSTILASLRAESGLPRKGADPGEVRRWVLRQLAKTDPAPGRRVEATR